MINKILIGSDEGNYAPGDGTRTITLSALSFTPIIEQAAYIYNKTQDVLYYAPAERLAKCTISGLVITIDSSFAVLATTDEIHIQFWLPERAYDVNQDVGKVNVENPEYDHYTSVEHIVDITNASIDTYFVGISSASFRNMAIQLGATDATGFEFKIYGTLDEDAAVPATSGTAGATWIEMTSTIFGGTVTGTSIAELAFVDTNLMPDRYLLEYTNQNAANTVDVWIRRY